MKLVLTQRIARLALVGFIASIALISIFRLHNYKELILSPLALTIDYGPGIIFTFYALYCFWQALKGELPFGHGIFLKKDSLRAVTFALGFVDLFVICFLYLAYYPPFQKRIDLTFYAMFNPFFAQILFVSFYFKIVAVIISISVKSIIMREVVKISVEYILGMLFFMHLFNILAAYTLWGLN